MIYSTITHDIVVIDDLYDFIFWKLQSKGLTKGFFFCYCERLLVKEFTLENIVLEFYRRVKVIDIVSKKRNVVVEFPVGVVSFVVDMKYV